MLRSSIGPALALVLLSTASVAAVPAEAGQAPASTSGVIGVASVQDVSAALSRMPGVAKLAAATAPSVGWSPHASASPLNSPGRTFTGAGSLRSAAAPTYRDIQGAAVNSFRVAFDPFSGASVELYTLNSVGYYGATDASYPRVGDVVYVSMYMGVVSPTAPSAAVVGLAFENDFARDVEFAISAESPVYCFYADDGRAWARFTTGCSQSPQVAPRGVTFDSQPVGPGDAKMIRVPIYVKKAKSGIGSGTFARFYTIATDINMTDGFVAAGQWMFVADRSVQLAAPEVPVLSNTTVTTRVQAYTLWKGGTFTARLGNRSGSSCTYPNPPANYAQGSIPVDQASYAVTTVWSGFDAGDALSMCWKASLTSGGATVTLPDQYFTRPASGSGTPIPPTGVVTPPTTPTTVVDRTAPTVKFAAPSPVTVAPRVTFSWSASDPSGIDGYDVQRATAIAPKAPSSFTNWALAPTATTGVHTLTAGERVCVRVRARDRAANVGAWSSPRCTTAPRDDRSLRRSTGWTSSSNAKAYRATISTSKVLGSKLTASGITASALVVLVSKAPGAGTVGVYVGTKRVALISLAATKLAWAVPVKVAAIARNAVITLKVEKTGTRGVTIDGLGLL